MNGNGVPVDHYGGDPRVEPLAADLGGIVVATEVSVECKCDGHPFLRPNTTAQLPARTEWRDRTKYNRCELIKPNRLGCRPGTRIAKRARLARPDTFSFLAPIINGRRGTIECCLTEEIRHASRSDNVTHIDGNANGSWDRLGTTCGSRL